MKKTFILGLFVASTLAVAVLVFINKDTNKNSGQEEEVIFKYASEIEDIFVFVVEKEDLSDADKEKYFEQFRSQRNAAEEALSVIRKEGSFSNAILYWPIFNLGNIHRDIGAYEKAKNAYIVAHELQPNAYPPLGGLGDLNYRYLSDFQEAEKYYLMAVEIEGDFVEMYYNELYEIYRFRYNDNEKAEQILISGFEKYPDKTNILASLALHYRQTGQIPKARETYERILEIKPDSETAKTGLNTLDE